MNSLSFLKKKFKLILAKFLFFLIYTKRVFKKFIAVSIIGVSTLDIFENQKILYISQMSSQYRYI